MVYGVSLEKIEKKDEVPPPAKIYILSNYQIAFLQKKKQLLSGPLKIVNGRPLWKNQFDILQS